jgi:hypothetical protein
MTNSPTNKQILSNKNSLKQTDPEKYARLKAEAQAPYKGLRVFFYLAFGASGFIGAIVFLSQLIAGRNITSALPNFALQIGLVALTIWLIRWENK